MRAGAGKTSIATQRVAALLFALLASATLFAAPASAGTTFRATCPDTNFECARVKVPLDRSGQVPGSIRLYVERRHIKSRGAVIALAGGPGQGATTLTENFNRDFSGHLHG